MVFSSEVFLFVFLPIVLIIYYNPIFKSRSFKNNFLLLASLFFYAWGEPVLVFLMIFSIIVTWAAGLVIKERQKKGLLVAVTVYHVFILFIFKYLTFSASQLGILLNKDFSFISISLPIGISFFTFQLMSYLFDIYYGKAKAQKNPLYVGLYVALFPQLIAGPIVRYETIAIAIDERVETKEGIAEGMVRFIYGLGKKVLISNYMAQLADVIFSFHGKQSVLTAWIGAIAYSLQLYFDFSGYSDMAIGLGRMFGFEFDENFNYPYIASSVTDFWKRWHISLSTWFRDYVYFPMGGSRVKNSRRIFNLFTIWLLTGIWHGAAWTYVAWGILMFLILIVEKRIGADKKNTPLSHVYTLIAITITMVVFRSETIRLAISYVGSMFGIGSTGFVDTSFSSYIKTSWLMLIIAMVSATPLFKASLDKGKKKKAVFLYVEGLYVIAVFLLSLIKIVSSSYNPFIYFNF